MLSHFYTLFTAQIVACFEQIYAFNTLLLQWQKNIRGQGELYDNQHFRIFKAMSTYHWKYWSLFFIRTLHRLCKYLDSPMANSESALSVPVLCFGLGKCSQSSQDCCSYV